MKNTKVVVNRLGGPEVLQVTSEKLPEPCAGEYRLRVLAAGVSYADLLMREGVHPETPPTPFTLGWDLVGVVDKDCIIDLYANLSPRTVRIQRALDTRWLRVVELKDDTLSAHPGRGA